MAIGEIRCPMCPNRFMPSANQIYCSIACRLKGRQIKLHELSSSFDTLPIYFFPPEKEDLLTKLSGTVAQNRVEVVLNFYAPEGAGGFRLGCHNRKPRSKFPQLHWFPTRSSGIPAIFRLASLYEQPHHLPYPGIYVVAYFTAGGTLIADPTSRIVIEAPVPPQIRWSHGDVNIHLGSKGTLAL